MAAINVRHGLQTFFSVVSLGGFHCISDDDGRRAQQNVVDEAHHRGELSVAAVFGHVGARHHADRRAEQDAENRHDQTASDRVQQAAGRPGRRGHFGEDRKAEAAEAVPEKREEDQSEPDEAETGGGESSITTCSGVATLEVRSGNSNLKPENAKTLSGGVVFQPLRNLTLTADYWSLRSDGVIGLQGAQNQILFDLLERLGGRSNPNVVRLAPVGTQVVGTIDYVKDDYFNLGPRILRGLDFAASLDLRDTALGNFNIDLSASKLLKYEQTASDLQAKLIAANAAGTLGTGITITQAGSQVQVNGNPEWRLSGNLTWRSGPVSAGALVSYVGSVFDTGTVQVNGQFYELPSYTTVNTYVQYRVPGDANALAGTRFRVGARNLFDKAPPLSSSNYGFLGALHDAVGRFVYFELSKEF